MATFKKSIRLMIYQDGVWFSHRTFNVGDSFPMSKNERTGLCTFDLGEGVTAHMFHYDLEEFVTVS